MIFEEKTRTQPISKEQVWASWKRIKQGGEGMGIDHVSIAMIEANPRKYLYPLWNRLSSSSYFPPAVREHAIPKGEGKERILGIPTILDRVTQDVIKQELEKIVEPLFHPSSFGYRPAISIKSQKRILTECKNLAFQNWVQMDIYQLSQVLTPKIRGWIYYYGNERLGDMQKVFSLINRRIATWLQKKFKLKTIAQAYDKMKRIISSFPTIFEHWKYGFVG